MKTTNFKKNKIVNRLFKGFFHGLKAADDVVVSSDESASNKIEIVQEKGSDSVFQDFLVGKETKRVIEYRDSYYRDFIASDHLNVKLFNVDDESKPLYGEATPKKLSDYLIKGNYYNPEKTNICVVQDNRIIGSQGTILSNTENTEALVNDLNKGKLKSISTIEIIRDEFIPRFKIEDYASKIVVRECNEKNKWFIDIYTTKYASQFGKIDALYIAELNRIYTESLKRSDTTDILGVKFVTDKAAGYDDLTEFEFDEMSFIGIDLFDGNFIIRYVGNGVKVGVDATEKYKTKDLDKKYENKSPRDGVSVDIFAAQRRNDNK